jgi:hypothetical protein
MSELRDVQQLAASEKAIESSEYEKSPAATEAAEVRGPAELPAGDNRHAAAGRIGAHRVQQLIRQGRLYEEEHGLTPGRQRLRQLIQEGKLYEQEHGLRPRRRSPRVSQEQALLSLFRSLLRLAKPAVRARLLPVVQELEAGT